MRCAACVGRLRPRSRGRGALSSGCRELCGYVPDPCTRQDVVGVPVEVVAGAVAAHRRAWVGVAGDDLDVAEANADVEHGGDEVCRGVCGYILGIRTPAARCLSRRLAASQSMRAPRVLRRIGPAVRPSTARSIARATAGGSGTRTTLPPLPRTRSTRWSAIAARSTSPQGAQRRRRRQERRPCITVRHQRS